MRVVSLGERPQPAVSAPQIRRVWLRYLHETREAPAWEYEQVERRAWQRLTGNLAALGAPVPDPEDSASGSSD